MRQRFDVTHSRWVAPVLGLVSGIVLVYVAYGYDDLSVADADEFKVGALVVGGVLAMAATVLYNHWITLRTNLAVWINCGMLGLIYSYGGDNGYAVVTTTAMMTGVLTTVFMHMWLYSSESIFSNAEEHGNNYPKPDSKPDEHEKQEN